MTPRPELLVSPVWLAEKLNDPRVCVLDCRLSRIPQPVGPSLWISEKAAWKNSHIPGAPYLHPIDDLCDPENELPFMLAAEDNVSSLLSRFGISHESTVVVYGSGGEWITHRVWWSLKASGVADVRMLDGGFSRWQSEGMPVEADAPSRVDGAIECRRNDRLIATRAEVKASMNNQEIVAINALSPELYRGEGEQVYGKPGHIPGSINIPADDLIEPDTGLFISIEETQTIFDKQDLRTAKKIIPYCGGGIAASTLFFALSLAGYENVALYDGSLFDWSTDPSLPMELGD